jgi:hypothetical protein
MQEPLFKILLRNRGLRLIDVARGLGVDKATVTRWARNEIPSDRVNDIVRITGIPAADLRPDLAELFATPTPSEVAG